MRLETIIGLETHVQLKTATKLFCSCRNGGDDVPPNTNICPICTGHPGTLPVPNKQAIAWAVKLGLALKGTITPRSKFDRKNYFYPDLPKAYQISQFDLPIMSDGALDVEVPGEAEPVRIRIERLHLEEDAAKNIHGADGKTYVDYNRGGTPLCEIVTRPDIRSAAQAKAYMQELRLIVRTLGVGDGDMEKGQLRCDVNISLREVDENGKPIRPELSPKTEIKNINSFRAVERAIAYEIKRQTELWEAGTPPQETTTRGWNDVKQATEGQRTKENSADYRYFPEPDVPPLALEELTREIKMQIPELPADKRHRFTREYGFKKEDARLLTDQPELGNFAEAAMSELGAWLIAKPEITAETMPAAREGLTKLFIGWLVNKLTGLLEERKKSLSETKLTPENFAQFITLLADSKLAGPKGLEVLGYMIDSGADAAHAMEEVGANRVGDANDLKAMVEKIVADNQSEAERYKAGEKKLMQFFIGQLMKETKGNADPAAASQAIREILG
ncbi:Asp-tRNA(Asn)/Glu-tRNA(Gln) amidotransferase subunit GatB [Patescibacteria group bacterium]|nr:Asp-tRNA(Asn)/Glu-tRNA(Gln) amidotransferase subunit GatB [Patescibacteria group bacterium]